ncbi:MAG: class IV adenylate cyclase [Candidatus Abawacabacteria bacterium]|nr:class IV adenylate cyclase [Candidatus Abawacabacteria bacterium]
MSHLNVEIKARCKDQNKIRELLKSKDADFKGVDHQIDTYFKVPNGRLKLREGNIENALIFYSRENKQGPKESHVSMCAMPPEANLKEVLAQALDILVVVDKEREIYFIENVKFHLDLVQGLGTFVEIEAIDMIGNNDKDKLLQQCNFYLELFGIANDDLLSQSYSDLLRAK